MRKIVAGIAAASLALVSVYALAEEKGGVSAADALKRLKEGNARYAQGKMAHPACDAPTRAEIAQSQHPFAIVLGCSDSRVAPEVLFDLGMGDLFVVRTAGNLIDDVVLGSIEYAAEHLGTPLVVVLGHERCGAVKATAAGGEAPGHLAALVKAIEPSVEKAKGMPGDLVENAVSLNVDAMVLGIKSSHPILEEMVKEGKLAVIGARYDLDTGEVSFKE